MQPRTPTTSKSTPTTAPHKIPPPSVTPNVQHADIPATATRAHAERTATMTPSPTADVEQDETGEPIIVAQYYRTNTSHGRPDAVDQVVNEYINKDTARRSKLDNDRPQEPPYFLALRTLYSKITIVALPNRLETAMMDLVNVLYPKMTYEQATQDILIVVSGDLVPTQGLLRDAQRYLRQQKDVTPIHDGNAKSAHWAKSS